jgi:hypothetical protein
VVLGTAEKKRQKLAFSTFPGDEGRRGRCTLSMMDTTKTKLE